MISCLAGFMQLPTSFLNSFGAQDFNDAGSHRRCVRAYRRVLYTREERFKANRTASSEMNSSAMGSLCSNYHWQAADDVTEISCS
jgi:hypothetical protein